MNALPVVPVAQLQIHQQFCSVRVRLLRMWGKLSPLGNAFEHLNLLFIDKDDVQIEGIIHGEYVDQFLGYFREDYIYIISHFVVEENTSSHRVSPGHLRLGFRINTVVRKREDTDDIPTLSFHFLTYEDFPIVLRNPQVLPDLVGRIVMCNQTDVIIPGLPLQRKRIRLQLLEGVFVTVVFWDTMIASFENLLPDAGVFGQVVALTSLYLEHDEDDYVFTASRATKIFVGLHAPHIHQLLTRFGRDVNQNDFISHLTYAEAVAVSPLCISVDLIDFQSDRTNMEEVFRVLARITELETSRCATKNSTIIHLTLVEEYAEFEVIFSSQYLRRIVAAVIPRDHLLHADFNTILNHLQGNQYEVFLKVSPWNRIGQYCELVLLKLFAYPD